MGDPEQLADLHARIGQMERHLVHLTTWLLAAGFVVLLLLLLLAVAS